MSEPLPDEPNGTEIAETPIEPSTPEPDTPKPDTGPARSYVGTGFYWPVVVGTLLAASIVVLVFQNTESVRLQFLWVDVQAPLVVVMLVTVLVTSLLTEAVGWRWRRIRRRILTDREELKRLKKS